MQPAAIPGAACGITIWRRMDAAGAAQVVGRFDERIVQAFQRTDQRHHHEQQRAVDECDEYGRVVVQQLHWLLREAEVHQHGRQHARFPQQDHPAQRAHRFADPERDQAQHEQQRATARPRTSLRDRPRDREREQQRGHGGQDRHHRRAHEGVPVQWLVDEGAVLLQARIRTGAAPRAHAATTLPGRRAAAR